MTTQSQRLRAALERQGFKPYETRSSRVCLAGPHASGATVYLFLDKVGGARGAREPRIADAVPISPRSIQLLLSGETSRFFGPVKE